MREENNKKRIKTRKKQRKRKISKKIASKSLCETAKPNYPEEIHEFLAQIDAEQNYNNSNNLVHIFFQKNLFGPQQ